MNNKYRIKEVDMELNDDETEYVTNTVKLRAKIVDGLSVKLGDLLRENSDVFDNEKSEDIILNILLNFNIHVLSNLCSTHNLDVKLFNDKFLDQLSTVFRLKENNINKGVNH